MQFPSWLQSVIQQRLDDVSAQIARHPEMRKLRTEEHSAFEAMFPNEDKKKMPDYMDWEDKHHFRKALENEYLYMQGMKNGVQLVIMLLENPFSVS